MDPTVRTQLLGAINRSPALKGMGVVVVGATTQEILQRPRGGASYLVLRPPPSAGRLAMDANLQARLRRLGISFTSLLPICGAEHFAIAATQKENAEMMKLQKAMQRENPVFTSVSNVLKTRHDTAKNSISNIR